MDKSSFVLTALLSSAAAATVAAPTLVALAVTVGEAAPNARVEDADENALWLSDLRGAPVVVFYEDKDSGEVNRPLKDELASLLSDASMRAVRVLPVADVSAYDSWPSRGFVRDAIREASAKAGLTVYCDWNGSFRERLGLEKETSNVVVLGKDGVVKFARTGALSADERASVVRLVKAELGK